MPQEIHDLADNAYKELWTYGFSNITHQYAKVSLAQVQSRVAVFSTLGEHIVQC